MDQENSFIEEINDNDLKDEWLKKAIVVLVAVSVLAGTYYLTNISGKKTSVTDNTAEQAILAEKNLKSVTTEKPDIKPEKVDIKVKSEQTLVPQKTEQPTTIITKGIKPSNKAFAIKAALLVAGKPDPFSDNSTKSLSSERLKMFLPKYIGKNPLSIPPSIDGLPTIGSLPNISVPGSKLMPGQIPYITPQAEVKGFIGNKVILSINGVSESLKANQWFKGIKVVSVDPQSMTVKLLQDHKVVTKSIKGLN